MAVQKSIEAGKLISTGRKEGKVTIGVRVTGGPASAIGRGVDVILSEDAVVSVLGSLLNDDKWRAVAVAMLAEDQTMREAYDRKELHIGYTPGSVQWSSAVRLAGGKALEWLKHA